MLTFADPGSRISASGASALLKIKTVATASHTECMSLVLPLTEASSTCTLLIILSNQSTDDDYQMSFYGFDEDLTSCFLRSDLLLSSIYGFAQSPWLLHALRVSPLSRVFSSRVWQYFYSPSGILTAVPF